MPVDIAQLATELTTDPIGRGYATMSNGDATESLNAADRTGSRPIEYPGLLKILVARGIYSKIVDATTDPLQTNHNTKSAAHGLLFLLRDEEIDVTEAQFDGLLSRLVTGSVIAQADKDAITAAATGPVSRAEELWGAGTGVSVDHVRQARSG